MKPLVLKCEKVDFSIYQNFFTVYPKEQGQKDAAFENTKVASNEEPSASCYDLLAEMENEEITEVDAEHNQCHKDALNRDINHLHYKFEKVLTTEEVEKILSLFLEDTAITSAEFEYCTSQFKKYASEDEVKLSNTLYDKEEAPIEEPKNAPIQKKSSNIGGPNRKPTMYNLPIETPVQKSGQPSNDDDDKKKQCNIM